MTFALRRYAFSVSAACALLTGCVGSQPPIAAPGAMAQIWDNKAHSKTFEFTGTPQSFVVPRSVKHITVTTYGASTKSALGAKIAATIPVSPGESLTVMVGGSPKGRAGGFNGGADGGLAQMCARCVGSGGAGASDIRENGSDLADRVIVAGGAGGEGGDGVRPRHYHGESNHGRGGSGGAGGQHAQDGENGITLPTSVGTTGGRGGKGATVKKYGRGGAAGRAGLSCWSGSHGKHGLGGAAGAGGINAGELALKYQPSGCSSCTSGAGGGGGGGYFGGGGGGGGGSECEGGGGGGGGGASYVEKTATRVTSKNGGAAGGPGEIIISW